MVLVRKSHDRSDIKASPIVVTLSSPEWRAWSMRYQRVNLDHAQFGNRKSHRGSKMTRSSRWAPLAQKVGVQNVQSSHRPAMHLMPPACIPPLLTLPTRLINARAVSAPTIPAPPSRRSGKVRIEKYCASFRLPCPFNPCLSSRQGHGRARVRMRLKGGRA